MSKTTLIIIVCIVALANLVLYWPANFYFLNDDFVHIPLTDDGVLFQQRSIRPIHELLVRLDILLWHKKAYGYHLTALILHAIVSVQLYFVAKNLQLKYTQSSVDNAQKIAWLAVALFLLYPQHAESLTWILGRTPTLSAIFFLAVIQLYLQKKYSISTYALAFVLFALTLFTYEQTILFPIIFLILAFVEKDKNLRLNKIYFSTITFMVAALYIVARKIITTEVVGAYEGGNFNLAHIQQLAANATRLIYRLFLNPSAITQTFTIVAVVFSVFVAIFLWINKNYLLQKPSLLFVITMLVLLAPIISLGITIRSYESGRYLYLPSIFLVIALAMYLQHKKVITVILVALTIYWGFAKYQSANHFKVASNYAQKVQTQVQNHFTTSLNDTLFIDTLHLTINRLPVYRMGFKTGIHWLNPTIDTNKIKVGYYYDEFIHQP